MYTVMINTFNGKHKETTFLDKEYACQQLATALKCVDVSDVAVMDAETGEILLHYTKGGEIYFAG